MACGIVKRKKRRAIHKSPDTQNRNIMIPTTLDDWTLSAILAIIEQGVFENDVFDFKEKLPNSRDICGKERLFKTCCAFANSRGGFLIFGVSDKKGLPPNARLIGLDPHEDFPEHFGAFPSKAEPSVQWTFRNPPIEYGERVLHVVHLFASRTKPHAYIENGKWLFSKRTSKGNEEMSYEEVRSAFVDSERRKNLFAWVAVELERIRRKATQMETLFPLGQDQALDRVDIDALRAQLPSIVVETGMHSKLVGFLNELTEAGAKLDRASVPFAMAFSAGNPTRDANRIDHQGPRNRYLPTILRCCDAALDELRVVEESGARAPHFDAPT